MPVLFIVLVGSSILSIAGIVLWSKGWGTDKHGAGESYALMVPGAFMSLGFGATVVLIGVMWATTYYGTYNDIQDLRAFQNETLSVYEYTVDRTESVVIDATETREGSFTDFSYQEQGKTVSLRIAELRDRVDWYNGKFYELQGKNRLPLWGAMYSDLPEDIKPIRIEYSP